MITPYEQRLACAEELPGNAGLEICSPSLFDAEAHPVNEA